MQGEAQDIHNSGGAGEEQLFQDCAEESLIWVLIFLFPFAFKLPLNVFLSWKKEHNTLILVSVQAIFGLCSKQFQGIVQVLLVLCKFLPP